MRKKLSCMLAAIFICGTSVFTSCTVDNADNPVKPIDNLSEKIIGKWITADRNGTPISTNMKQVLNFVSASEAYCSTSMENTSNFSAIWKHHSSFDVSISGNVVTLTENSTGEGVKVKDELDIVSISATELTAKSRIVLSEDGKESFSADKIVRMVKLTVDYSETILGTWECDGLTGGETYNDANARLEFLADGTYRYYRKNDAGEWEPVTTRDYQKYFVDGTLLATCWKNNGEDELREWWEIASVSGDKMQWTSLRHNADGTTFNQDMKWHRITPEALDLSTLTEAYTVQDGQTITGNLAKAVQISVADGASITIKDVSINAEGIVYPDDLFSGITCLGDATITLSGTNAIRGFNNFYPAIFVPENHTLTIQGDGSLDVKGSGTTDFMCAAIGSVRAGATCGNLVFLGGKIIAAGGYDCAAIGASYASVCGNITIGGTAEITVAGHKDGAGIGTGSGPYEQMSMCGDITIGGQAIVKTKGAPAIGAFTLAKCGNITIGEEAYVVAEGISYAPGIGCGDSYTLCNGITISGGTVIASCDKWGPGIGISGTKKSICKSITISGGKVMATGGEDGPGIGSGPDSTDGVPIVITSGATEVTAVRGSDLADYIGTGDLGTRGSVTIDGVEDPTPESVFPHFDTSVTGNSWTLKNKSAN